MPAATWSARAPAPRRKPIVTGSHCDTVLSGGRYDGIIGVLAGIEVAHTLHEHGVALRHPFEVIDFLSEEPSDYGISCVGSRASAASSTPPCWLPAIPKAKPWRRPLRASAATRPR